MNLPASPVKHHDVQIRRLATFAHVKTLQRDFIQLYKIGKKISARELFQTRKPNLDYLNQSIDFIGYIAFLANYCF